MNNSRNQTITEEFFLALDNPCSNLRAISRPILFVHHYSLLLFGSFLNLLAFFILMQNSLRCHSTFAYLAFLSFSNGLLSLVRFSQWMFTYYLNIQFENFLSTCRFYHFALDFLTHFSLFTLVCVNIDRARTVTRHRPTRKLTKSAFSTVCITESLIASILATYHSHWLIKFGYQINDGSIVRTVCQLDPSQTTNEYFYFLSKIYPLFELTIIFCLPLLINIICTIIIVRSLRMRTAKRYGSLKSTSTGLTPKFWRIRLQRFLPKTTSKSNIYWCCCCQIQCRRHTKIRLCFSRNDRSLIKYEDERDFNDRPSLTITNNSLNSDLQPITSNVTTILNKKQQIRRTRDKNLSAMLIVLNILYFLLNLPFNFHQTFLSTVYQNPSDECIMKLTHVFLDLLQQTYFATNFFLYVLTNRRFREEFYKTMRKICRRNSTMNFDQHQRRSGSVNPSTIVITNCHGNYQTISVPQTQHRESCLSDIELTETSPLQQGQNHLISKLVLFKEHQ